MIRWLGKNSFKGKSVILRADFNVPMSNGTIVDDFKVRAHLPTLHALLGGKNTIVILTHLGKPGGKRIPALSAKPLAHRLSRLLKKSVTFIPDPLSPRSLGKIAGAKPASVFLVENVRFWKGEEGNSPTFAKSLSRLGEAFVEDAFGVSHRKHATLTLLPRLLPAYGGLLLKKEIDSLTFLTRLQKKPFIIIMGGSKISTKLKLLTSCTKRADKILLGGALANTALAALGYRVGRSLVERAAFNATRKILKTNTHILLPTDIVVAAPPQKKAVVRPIGMVKENEIILDIGPETRRHFIKELKQANTIFWNGPLGLVEEKKYIPGTLAIAKALGEMRAYKVIGGGDLIAFFDKHQLQKGIAHFASGGGSTLAFLAGEKLPGLEAIKIMRRYSVTPRPSTHN